MDDSCVLIGGKVVEEALRDAVASALHSVGFEYAGTEDRGGRGRSDLARREGSEEVTVWIFCGAEQSLACLSYPLGLARSLARHVAARVSGAMDLFLLEAVHRDRGGLQCRCEHLQVRPDGATATGPIGKELEAEFGPSPRFPEGRWEDLCDQKFHYAIGSLADAVEGRFFVEDDGPTWPQVGFVYRERTVGSPRLNDMARRIRSAERAEIVTLHGQIAIRIQGPDNAKVTSFVSHDEVERLRAALGPVLLDRR